MKILIVDDETPIREWIQFSIERGGNPEFEIAAVAESGNEAFDMALKHQPDVVITDIKMPGMDGIELMKKVLEVSPYTNFVILTNYAEFSYAREAVTYGAKKYLLKSELRGRDILSTLEEIYGEIQEKAGNKEKDCYSNGYLDIFDCYYNLDNKEFLEDFWKRHGFRPGELFLVTAFEQRDGVRQKEVMDRLVGERKIHAIGPALKNRSIYLIFQAGSGEELTEAAEWFSEGCRRENLGLMVSGHMGKGLASIMEAIEEAEKMLRYTFLLDTGYLRIEDAMELLPLDRASIKKNCQKILAGILYEGEEVIQEALVQWFQSLHGAPFADIQWVKEMCIQLVIRIEEICAAHIPDFSEEHHQDMDWTLKVCGGLCRNLVNRIYSEDNFRYSQSVRDAIRYIHDNYNRDISLNEVARYIYRSPEYLSRLFKSETGEKFSSYLMSYRLNKARDMLINTDMKIYEIAYAVGYTTPSYFSKMYRDFMGVGPEVTRSQRNTGGARGTKADG